MYIYSLANEYILAITRDKCAINSDNVISTLLNVLIYVLIFLISKGIYGA